MTESKKKTSESGRAGRNKGQAHNQEKAQDAPVPEEAEQDAPAAADAAAEERDQLNDRLLRLQADFDNFRKRTQREREQLRTTANSDLLEDLLPVLDHFEMGLANAKKHDANPQVLEGFQLVYDQLMGALKRCGLDSIESVGLLFDPHLHEAITHLSSEEHPADTVITETRRGYALGDQLLRAAQVVVSSGAQVDEAEDERAPAQGETPEEEA